MEEVVEEEKENELEKLLLHHIPYPTHPYYHYITLLSTLTQCKYSFDH